MFLGVLKFRKKWHFLPYIYDQVIDLCDDNIEYFNKELIANNANQQTLENINNEWNTKINSLIGKGVAYDHREKYNKSLKFLKQGLICYTHNP